ncbi:MFS transporter [Parasphingorhabdus pacifica]
MAWLVWGVGAVCYFVSLFHRASLGVAAPAALERFSSGPALLAIFSALQLGVYLALQVPSGVLADRLGPRRVIAAGMLALGVGSAIFAVSGSAVGGVAGRMLIGFGDAFMFTNVLRLAAQWFPAERFGRIAALTGLIGGTGQLVSTIPLTASLSGLGWVPTFLGAAGVTMLLAVAAWMLIRDRPAAVGPQDERAPEERVGQTLRAVVGRRGTRHSFWVHFVLMSQFLAITALWGAPWLTQAQGYGESSAGMLLMCCVLVFIAGSWFAGQFISGRTGRRERFTFGLSVAVAVSWLVLIGWPGALPMPVLLAVLAVIGAGGGASMLAFDGARAANAAHRSGTATGVVNMGGFTAAVLIQLSVGLMLRWTADLPVDVAYRWAFAPVVVLLAVGTGVQVVLRESRVSRIG